MGLLSDIYISRDTEAVKYDTTPNAFIERAQYKGITSLELSTLWTIMRGIEWDVAMMDDFACLLEKDGGERTIHSFPAAMIQSLGQLTTDQIRDFSVKWAATEEITCSPADIQPVVEEMTRLARSAAAKGCGLYIWNCV
jgi:hypothetical protein